MQLSANGLALEVDDQGPPSGPAVLLIMGLGMQLTAWPDVLVRQLLQQGFRVIRFDNRDAGLSQGFDHLGVPNMLMATARHFTRMPIKPPYTLADMAADAVGVLDALGIQRAHVCGASLGGMVAQHVAASWPQRVRSLTLLMTTAGARHLPGPTLAAQQVLLSRPADNSLQARVNHGLHVFRRIGSPDYPPDPTAFEAQIRANILRAWHPSGTTRQLVAVAADGDRTPLLARIGAPTHVMHGLADPLVPSACGSHLAQHIQGATIDLVPGMGHDFPLALMPRLADGITRTAARAE